MNFGLIADGNRRWARREGLKPEEGHKKGFWAIKDHLYPFLRDHKDFNAFTVYAFSTENWKRSPFEVRYLMKLYGDMLDEWLPKLMEEGVKLVHCGRKDRIPKFLREKVENAEEVSAKNKKFTIYLCLDYGGRDEIIRAAEKGDIEKNLEVAELDIVLRTGGEQRLSNFCIWQAAYAEFFFIPECLPELTVEHVEKVVGEFMSRNRRKGGN